jgi:hypothetical protein
MKDKWSKTRATLVWALTVMITIGFCTLLAIDVQAETPSDAGYSFYSGTYDFGFNLGKPGKAAAGVYIANRIVAEGQTSDAYEATMVIPDPASDITYTFPAASGTLATTDGTFSGTLGVNTVDSDQIVANAVKASEIDDATITPTQLGANSLTASDAFMNTVTKTITAGNTGFDQEVEAGSILLRVEKVSGFNNDVTITKSVYPDAGNQWIVNTDAHAGSLVINGIFWRPAP